MNQDIDKVRWQRDLKIFSWVIAKYYFGYLFVWSYGRLFLPYLTMWSQGQTKMILSRQFLT